MTRSSLPWYLTVAMGLCGVAAVVASFLALTSLAAWADWPGLSAILLPIMVDSLGGACLVVWLRPGFPAAARSLARRWALTAVIASAAMNAVSHTVTASGSAWRIGLVVTIGAMPPLALAALIEVAVRITGPLPTRNRVEKSRPVVEGSGQAKLEASPELPSEPARPLHAVNSVHDVDLVAKARDLDAAHQAQHGRGISVEALRKELGVRKATAAEIRELARSAA